jgi:hypothetical protein
MQGKEVQVSTKERIGYLLSQYQKALKQYFTQKKEELKKNPKRLKAYFDTLFESFERLNVIRDQYKTALLDSSDEYEVTDDADYADAIDKFELDDYGDQPWNSLRKLCKTV